MSWLSQPVGWNFPPGMSVRELEFVEGGDVLEGVCEFCGVLLSDDVCGLVVCWGEDDCAHCSECCPENEDGCVS